LSDFKLGEFIFMECRGKFRNIGIISTRKLGELYGQSALAQVASNIKFLTVFWGGFPVRCEVITEISDRLETLELRAYSVVLCMKLEKF
jgi:hypothetical protein